MRAIVMSWCLLLCAPSLYAADEPVSARAAAKHANLRCNDVAQPRRGDHGFRCIETTEISEESFCLRKTGLDPIHVRGGKTADAFVTPNAPSGQLGYAVVDGEPEGGNGVCTPDVVFMESGQLIHIEKKGGDKLQMQFLPVNMKLQFPVSDPIELTLHRGGKQNLYFYAKGTYKGVDFYLMVTDDFNGFMNADDAANVGRIEHYFRIEAFANGACQDHRPDAGPADGSSYFQNFYQWTTNSGACNSKGHSDENGSGGGGHQWP